MCARSLEPVAAEARPLPGLFSKEAGAHHYVQVPGASCLGMGIISS